MALLTTNIYRVAVTFGLGRDYWIDPRTKQALEIPAGVDLRFEIGIEKNSKPQEFYDLTDVVSLKLEVKNLGTNGKPPDETSNYIFADLDVPVDSATLTPEQWAAETHQHVIFNFASAETNWLPGEYWMVLSAEMADGKKPSISWGRVKIVEDGTGAIALQEPLPASYYTAQETEDRIQEILQAGGTITNLTWNPATSTVESSDGNDAILTLVDDTNPGLMSVADKADVTANTTARHTHGNKAILDGITDAGSGQIITATERSDIAANTSARHTHANKAILDAVTAAFTTANQTTLGTALQPGDNISTLTNDAGYTGDTTIRGVPVDASVATPSDGDILVYRSAGSDFVLEPKPTGGAGATNLSYTASPTDGTVASDTGTDATIPAGSTVNASLMLPGDKTKLNGIASNANNYVHPNHTGDVISTSDGATTIANNVVTLAKLADMASNSFIARNTTGTGDPEVVSSSVARLMIGITNLGSTAIITNSERAGLHTHANKAILDAITAAFTTANQTTLGTALQPGDVINTLVSLETNKPLSAAQGKVLKDLIDALGIADIAGLQGALDAKAALSHTHTDGDINSEASLNGQVLTSNGAGGATWQTPSSGVTDHTLLSNIGVNTHVQIDSHIASTSNPHGVTAAQIGALTSVSWGDIQGNVFDQIDLQFELDNKADASHSHVFADISDFNTGVTNNANVAANSAARHTHANKAILDLITSAGSGQIITTAERTTLGTAVQPASANTLTNKTINADNNTLQNLPWEKQIACSDLTSNLSTGTAKAYFRMPHAVTLTGVRASVITASVGANIIVDINESGVSILSTLLSIDASEKTSTTAATPAVISDSALADDAEITIDIDQVGSTTAGAGLIVTLIGKRA